MDSILEGNANKHSINAKDIVFQVILYSLVPRPLLELLLEQGLGTRLVIL